MKTAEQPHHSPYAVDAMPDEPAAGGKTAEEWREVTEEARRSARFKFATDRIRKIVDGAPPLTDEQRTKLALLLHPGSHGQDG